MRTRLLLVALATFPPFLADTYSATLSGRVVDDHAGAAVASADVRVFRTGVRGLAAELETDSDGRFSAEELPDGEYRIEVSKSNHIASAMHTKLSASAASNLSLRLVRCGAISGRVLDTTGQPINGAVAFALRVGTGSFRPDRTTGKFAFVDAEGRYRLFNLPPGQYVVAANYGSTTMLLGSTGIAPPAPGVGSGVLLYPSNARPQPFTITSGETFQNVDISILPSNLYSVTGRVETGTDPKPKGQFWLALASTEQPAIAVAATTAKQDGSFQFSGIPSGSYDLFAAGPSNGRGMLGASVEEDALFARTRVTVGSQDVENLVVSPQKGLSVSFKLQAPPGGGCASAGQMVLANVEDWGTHLEQRFPVSFTQPQTVTRLAPARYRVSVTGLGETCHVPEDTMIDLTTGRDVSPVTITAVPAGAIHGIVSGASSLTGLTVVLADLTDRSQPLQVTTVNAESQFAYASLRPGRYRVSVKLASGASARWTDESSPGVNVEVTGGNPVKVTITLPAN